MPYASDHGFSISGQVPGPSPRCRVDQDGAVFYVLERDPETGGTVVSSVWTFADPVRDGDMDAARRARAWFVTTIAAGWITPVFDEEG